MRFRDYLILKLLRRITLRVIISFLQNYNLLLVSKFQAVFT
jgi:hypothetical protein